MSLPLDAGSLDLVWTALGRVPAFAVLLWLTLEARRTQGTRAALLGASGFAAGALLGTALVPSVLGALGGGFAGAMLSWAAIGAPYPSPRAPTMLLLGVIALGRWGCFISGCCFGHVTDSAWGVAYGPQSFAHLLHQQLGLVAAGDSALPVIPVPAIESLGICVILFIGVALRKRLTDGALSLLLIGSTLVLRAAIDPLRAMVNTASSVSMQGPLSLFQWGALTAAAACFALAWRSRRERVQRRPRSTAAWVCPAVWLAQVAVAFESEAQGTWFLRVLSVVASAGAASVLLVEWESARRLRLAFAVAAMALLLPVASRAGDAPAETERGDWLYVVEPKTETLVRVGTSSEPLAELEKKAASILGEEPSPPPLPSPSLTPARAPPPVPERQPVPEAVAEAPPTLVPQPMRRHTLGVSVLGGQQAYSYASCSGLSSGLLRFGDVAVQYEHQSEAGNVAMARARLLGGASNTGVSGGGALSGLYEFRWKHGSVGLGATFAVMSSTSDGAAPQSAYFVPGLFPSMGPAVGLTPLLYFRIEAIMGFAFELGTGSVFQPQDGGFANFRFGFDDPEKVAGRVGIESTWLPHPIMNTNIFVDVGFPIAMRHRIHLRLTGHPWDNQALSGGLRWTWQL